MLRSLGRALAQVVCLLVVIYCFGIGLLVLVYGWPWLGLGMIFTGVAYMVLMALKL